MKTLQLHPEFNVTLAADENVAEKIMSLDWDARGRLWVVETPEYPGGRDINKNDAKITPWRTRDPEKFPGHQRNRARPRSGVDVGRHRQRRRDGQEDGVRRRPGVADLVVFYKDGVIVSQAPDTLWIRDTNGDGKADKTEVLFTGWGTFDTHAVTSNLRGVRTAGSTARWVTAPAM
jgi:hypothetical protein